MEKKVYKDKIRHLIREMVHNIMNENSKEISMKERSLTPAEEKKKEELVKALKPKYGKTPKTYAIATAKAKELAEDEIEERMLAFPDKTKAPGRNKKNLPYHSPVSITLDEIEMDEEIEIDEEVEFTDKYDDSPALKGGQSKLPDHLQKAIIQKNKK